METTLTLSVLLLSGTAQAGNFIADCEGWSDFGTWAVPHPADIVATATLECLDAEGAWAEIEQSVSTQSVQPEDLFAVSGAWTQSVIGDCRADLTFAARVIYSETNSEWWHWYASYGPFTCEPPPPSNNLARTPGYWKNHPESWPVTELDIGGVTYSQACLLDFLDLPTRGDVRIKLIHHLIAAKLNLLPNSIPGLGSTDPTTIADTAAAADAFLASTLIDCGNVALSGRAPRGADRNTSNALKDALDRYNNNVSVASQSSALSAEEEGQGGCSAMNAAATGQAFLLPLLAMLFLRRRRS